MEDEDPTPASSSPPPINEDASPVASPLVGSDPASSSPPRINEDVSPVASLLVGSDNQDTDDDGDDVDGEEKDEEKPWMEELHDCDLRRPHFPSPVTISKTPEASVAVGVPISKSSPAAAASGREDCWSEGATWALIEAWGERHLRSQAEPQGHQRGGLRQKDWDEVADAVCSRGGGGKQAKSEGQCKNRIDTLKKKYKVERIKPHSSWPYFRRMNDLLAADYEDGAAASGNALDCKPPVGVGFGSFRHQLQQLQMKKKKRTTKKRSHRQLLQSVRALPFLSMAAPRHGKEAYSDDGLPSINGKKRKMTGRDDLLLGGPISARPLARKGVNGPEVGLRDLARAVMRLGEVYERIEKSKLRQEEELEKRRMGLAKELEVQRMDFFMKTLLELRQHHQKKPKRLATPNATENPVAPAINTSNDSNKSAVSGEE